MKTKKFLLLIRDLLLELLAPATLAVIVSACGGGGGGAFSGLDTSTSIVSCTITTTVPTNSTVKVSGTAGVTTIFTAGVSSSNCPVIFSVNGLPVSFSGNTYTLDPATLTAGDNTVTATTTSNSYTWTVHKNNVPSCQTMVPAATGNTLNVGGSLVLSSAGADADNDALTYNWNVNGNASNLLSVVSTPGSSQATFTPDSSLMGGDSVHLLISDGIDTTTCTWTVNVTGTCSIGSTTPSNTTPIRVSSVGTTSTALLANTSGGCTQFSWTLNGSPITGATAANYNVLSSNLLSGANILQVSATNGTATDTKSWTVIKNTPPTCSSQVPTAATANSVSVGSSITLTANGADTASLPLTFTWKDNGTNINSSFITVTPGTNSSQALFTPDVTFVGNNAVSAVISDGYDSASCTWNVPVSSACQISSSAPSTTTVKIANNASTSSTFAATANDSSCAVTWKLNGNTVTGATSALLALNSSQFTDGPTANTLQAIYSNGNSSATRTWTVTKNRAVTCASQVPTATGNTLGIGSNLTLAGTAGNPDSNTLAYTWSLNGTGATSSILNTSSSGNVAQAIFSPNTPLIGSNTINMSVNDGYDTAACNWTVAVNGACALSSPAPATASSVRVSSVGTTSTLFQASASTGCSTFTWTLNGTPISGATSSAYNVLSSALSTGANILQLSVTNGTSTDTKTWTVIKNIPPTCSAQSPAASGSSVGIGSSITLTADGNDSAALPLTFVWKNNGNAVNSRFFSVNGAGTESQAVFTPDSTYVGNNSISALISDGYDSTSCNWAIAVVPSCSISSSAPASSTYKVAYNPTAVQAFVATANDASCAVTWKLNGNTISGATAAALNLTSSQLNDGPSTNTLQAIYSNGSSSATKTWTVTKNQPPTCATQSPTANGNSLGVGANLGFNLTAGNADSDTLTYNWLLNNTSVATSVLNPSSSGNSSQSTFYPTSSFVGPNLLTAVINDGYDSVSCNWNVTVNGNCAISSTTPTAPSSVRVSSLPSTSTLFQAVTSSGCSNYTWTLNGSPISGATSSSYNALSSALNTGSNILQVAVTNGTSTDTKQWTVVKNTPPTCSSQTPASNGSAVSVGANQTFTANGADANSLPLTFTWSDNGTAVNSSFFTVTTSGGTSRAVFAPDSSFVGTNNLTALISDGYDTASCNWAVSVAPTCQIGSSSPSTSTFKVPFSPTNTQSFVATANDPSCTVTWKLNGTAISGETSSVLNLASSQFNAGPTTNTLQAVYSNGATTATKTWTVTKNRPVTCGTQTPVATGNSLGVGSNLAFGLNATNPDSDTINYTWAVNNNASVSTSVLNPTNSGNTSSATFYPTSLYVGPNLITSVLYDGYDTATCNWNVTVNGSCAISTTTPATTSSVRVANAGTTSTSFNAVTSPACSNYTWTLNGSTVAGATSSTYNVISSDLNPGTNILQVLITNGTSSDSKQWTVVKNTPPVCSSQSPASTGNAVGVGSSLTLTANATDANSDALTFAWQNNGSAVNSSFFTVTNAATNSHAVFAPDATFVGNNSISAIINDGYDSTSCTWAVAVAPQCVISSSSPSTTTFKIPNNPTSAQSFVATANDASCAVTWKLNGTAISGASSSVLNLTSSQFTDGPTTNTLQAVYSNGSSTATKTWTVTKNRAVTCATQAPSPSGNSLGVGSNLAFNLTAGNQDSDSLAYTWSLNNAAASTAVLNPSSSGNSASATFYPTSLQVGPNIVTAAINDGYDSASCNWNVTVNGSCAISSTAPTAGTSTRVPSSGSTSTNFQAITSPACSNYTWTLNGSAISSATGSSYNVLSSALNAGANTLQVAVTNGTSTDTKSWTVVKNIPPTCSSQTPTATGNNVGVGSSLTFTATGNDPNSLPLTYAWQNNGSAVNSTYFAVTSTGGSSQAVFSPNATYVGSNNLSAVMSDGYDSASCNWSVQVLPQCSISSASPSTSTFKIPYSAGTANAFVATANDASCTVTWKLNGVTLSGATSSVLSQTSAQFNDAPGANILQAVYSNGSSTATRSWTVNKNQPPTCATQSPAATGNSLGVGANLGLSATAGNPDSDTLSYLWTLNNSAVSTSLLNPSSTGNSTAATFYPTSLYTGANVVTMNVSDGYDNASCNWSVNVNPSCQITATTPSTGTNLKVAAAAATSTSFQTTASTGCTQFTWTLNGTPISGATGSNYAVTSSLLSPGANILQVSVTNGTSTDTKQWTVVKNTPPVCSSQSPTATQTLGSGQSLTLAAAGTDANSDPLTFSWFNNTNAASATYFTITNGTGNSQAVFAPDSSFVGTNNISAVISDGLDTNTCNWAVTVKPQCQISSSSPSTTTYKVANAGTTSQTYIASVNDSSCTPTWTLNGSTLAGQTNSNVTLTSSQLNAGPATNTLVATYSNGSTSTTRTWTITRNQAPTCSTQTPAATGNSLGVGGNLTFVGNAGNADNDTLSFNWTWNGNTVASSILNPTSGVSSSQAVFTPTSAYVGNNSTAAVQISDGYDTASCSWNVNVVNSCSISSSSPSTSTYKIPYATTTSNAFVVFASDTSCIPTWKLNGTTVASGANLYAESFTSSLFNNGPATNTLSVTLDNGVSTTTRSWVVTKNQVPACSSIVPATNPTPMPYTSNINFTANLSDPDSDTLKDFSWTLNGVTSSTLFTPTTSGAATSTTTFKPTFAQVATGQKIAFNFDDGYDAQSCSWTMDIVNPNTVSILSCNPSGNPIVVYSTGTNSTQTLQVVASNASNFQWLQNGSNIGGATSASYAIAASSYTAGTYTFRGVASDSVGNAAHCDYNVVVNAPPVINTFAPVNTQTWKMNVGSTMTFNVAATDANSDTLSYTWTLDGTTNAALPTGNASTVFTPNYNYALVGTHTISVTVTDGYETTTKAWTVVVNLFSNACNTLYNGPVSGTGATGGEVCTLVGIPTIGNGANPTTDQNKMRIHPDYMIDDGAGNWFITDTLSNAVHFYNRSGSSITRFGKTIAAGTMVTLIGNGANGVTSDNVYNNTFKLDNPQGIAYDAAGGHLFIADYNNHRVAMMDNTGYVTTVLGITGSGTNNTSTNTDGQVGTSSVCTNPAGLDLINYGGTRFLYVSCYGTSTIKKLDVLSTSGTYLKAYIVVGALTGGVSSAGTTDGTLGATGTAKANGPWAISDDGLGNIYWSEWSDYRVRMATTAGSAMSFFGGASYPLGTFNITATDTAAVLTAASSTINPIAQSSTMSKLNIAGPAAVVTGNCSPYRVESWNAANTAANSSGVTAVTLTGAGAGGQFYSDNTCATALPSGVINIANATSESTFYYKNTGAVSTTFTATASAITATLPVVAAANGVTPAKLAVYTPPNYDYTTCARITVQAQNASGVPSNLTAAKTILMSNNAVGNFFTSSTCTGTPTTTFTMPLGVSEMYVYYASTMIAPANQSIGLFGTQSTNSIFPSTNTPTSIGNVTLRDPRGLVVKTSGATVQGFFVSAYDQHRDIYVNNTASSITLGGTAILGYSAGVIAGTGTAAFNTDGIGDTTRIWTGYGLSLSADGNTLLIPDYDNYRVRALDISTGSGILTTYIGAGYSRSGNLGDSPLDATSMYLNTPGEMTVDTTNNLLYVSDSGNGRIRRVNLVTGYVDTAVGKGTGAATTENDDPTNIYTGSPRGLMMMNTGGTNFLVYADQQSTGVNNDCQIRALNLTSAFASPAPSAVNFFSTSVNPSKVATIAGNYALGCQAWATAPANTNGMSAVNSHLYYPEGIANDGTNLYMTLFNDHCIVKMTPDGNINPIVGTCGTAGTLDGSTTVATIRYPMGIVIDPAYATYGNFFFVDAVDTNPSRVRYVNFAPTTVSISGSTVPAATSPNGIVQTIWTVAPSGNSQARLNGMAIFGNQICISGGYPTSGGGSVGTHNVTCYDRTSSLGASLRVGPNELSSPPIRGGAPLDTTQEGAPATSALMNAPYGLTFDSAGNLYISERYNHLVRMVRRWY